MVVTIVPVVMVIGGGLLYAFATNGKLAEIGRLLVLAGLFAFAFANAGKVVSL